MKLSIAASLDYYFAEPTDVLLQIEAAMTAEQWVEKAHIAVPGCLHFQRIDAQDAIGERIWLRIDGRMTVDYHAVVAIDRPAAGWPGLPRIEPHRLPAECVPYLMPSRYCPSDQFHAFVTATFGALAGGAQVAAMRDWIEGHMQYVPGASTSDTTAIDTFVHRQGICRDYAHLLICFARAAGIPARIASVYALGVKPQDFHAVAEVYLGGAWHLVDATGMAASDAMAKIGIGRDAADVAFLSVFGAMTMNGQSVSVLAA